MGNIHPMGALGCDQQKIEELYNDNNYVAEKKFDGSRYVLSFINKKATLTSRCESVKGGMVDKTKNVPQIIKEVLQLDDVILDGEIDLKEERNFSKVQGIMGSLPERALEIQKDKNKTLYYKCFDILSYRGYNLKERPLKERRKILELIFRSHKYKFNYIILVDQISDPKGKRELFGNEIDKGSEGIILKNINSIYVAGEDKTERPRNTWYKVKLLNTYDGIVTGYNIGTGKYSKTVGSLIVKQYKDGKLIEVANVGGMNDKLRDEFKKKIDNGEQFIIEFKAQEPEGENRYRHPRFKRIRLDKNKKECVYGQK